VSSETPGFVLVPGNRASCQPGAWREQIAWVGFLRLGVSTTLAVGQDLPQATEYAHDFDFCRVRAGGGSLIHESDQQKARYMNSHFDGLGMHLGNLARLSPAQSRSISAENRTGGKGKGGRATEGTGAYWSRDLGQGWKVSPSIPLTSGSTTVLADIDGPGAIQHIWMTVEDPARWRQLVLRIFWDREETPSVEVPIGDFFCNGWCTHCNVNSLPVAVNPAGGFNCFWEMPFRQHATVTVENLAADDIDHFFYQIDYTLTDVPDDRAYFHSQWRRSNPVPYGDVHTLLDGVQGRGQYVGAYFAWGVNNDLWWSEGEVKIYLDGDSDWPTICGTGLEDYVGGAWTFEWPRGQYGTYSTAFMGLPQIVEATDSVLNRRRFGMYRWHVMDPIRFQQDIRVTVQALGLLENSQPRYLPSLDDVASTAFWYQTEPHASFPGLPDMDHLAVT